MMLPSIFSNETDRHTRFRVSTTETIENIYFLTIHILFNITVNFIEDLFTNRLVRRNRTPPDITLTRFSFNKIFILRRTTSVDTSINFKGTSLSENTFIVLLFMFSNFIYTINFTIYKNIP